MFLSYDIGLNRWDTIHFSGDRILPRFFAGMAVSPDYKRIYVYGGKGNESGDQNIGLEYFYDLYQIDMEKRQESALMAFVLFNVADEIVTDRNAGIAYQEGNNRVCILFMGNRSREFSREIQEICQEIQKKVKEKNKLPYFVMMRKIATAQ